MKGILEIVLVSIVTSSVWSACNKLYCQGITSNNICAKNHGLTDVFVHACPNNQYCDWNTYSANTAGTCKIWDTQSGKNPKVEFDSCANNAECASKLCVKQVCVGLKQHAVCITHRECGAAFYCDRTNDTCQLRKAVGETCVSDWDCLNDSRCHLNKCIKLYSFKVGTFVLDPKALKFNTNSFFFCESQFASDTTGKCEHLTPVYNNCTFIENSANNCSYVSMDTKQHVNRPGSCFCSSNPKNEEFCMKGTNTPEFKNYLDGQLKMLAKPCHFDNKKICSLITPEERIQDQKNFYDVIRMDYKRNPCLENLSGYTNTTTIRCFYSLLVLLIILLVF